MLDLQPPKTTLQQKLVSRLECRLSVVTEIATHMGASESTIKIAQAGFADGTMNRLTVRGLDGFEYTRMISHLWFDDLIRDDQIALDLSNGRSMTEAVSIKLARAVEHDVAAMRRQGLTPLFQFGFKPAIANDPGAFQNALARYGLVASTDRGAPPGTALRKIYHITPGRDKGMHYEHWRAHATS